MANEFVWDEKYSVNDEEIDQQHKSLFDREEEHMKKINFPSIREHKVLHDDLITTLNNITGYGLKTKREANEFEKFIYRWLSRHIQTEDKKYADFTSTSK